MTRLFKILVYISDIHFGKEIISAKEMKRQLIKNFFDHLYSMRHLDAVFVCGDIADRALGFNTDYASLYLWFGRELLNLGRKTGCAIIVVKGTQSHDMDQLKNWVELTNNEHGVDFRIYDNYQSVILFEEGYKTLILPDKKVTKSEEKYVDELLEDNYDLIVGHGMIDKMRMFQQDSENMTTVSYMYNVDTLMNHCRGPVVFGHIHPHTNIKDKFFYCSSFTKLERNEGEHGFLVCGIMNKDRKQFKVEFVNNPDSAESYYIKISREELDEYDIETILKAIDSVIDSMRDIDLLQIKIKMEDKRSIIDKVLIIEERYKFHKKNIVIVKKVKSKAQEIAEEKNREDKERYAYIMDGSLSMEDIIVRFFNEETRAEDPSFSKIEFNPEVIREILSLV